MMPTFLTNSESKMENGTRRCDRSPCRDAATKATEAVVFPFVAFSPCPLAREEICQVFY